MAGLSGMELQAELVSREINLPIIFLTGHGNIELCVQAMKAGALEFFTKPFDPELLLQAVERVLSANQIRQQAATNYMHHNGIVGTSAGLRKVLRQIDLVSGTDATVLITGESGTGKESRCPGDSRIKSSECTVVSDGQLRRDS